MKRTAPELVRLAAAYLNDWQSHRDVLRSGRRSNPNYVHVLFDPRQNDEFEAPEDFFWIEIMGVIFDPRLRTGLPNHPPEISSLSKPPLKPQDLL